LFLHRRTVEDTGGFGSGDGSIRDVPVQTLDRIVKNPRQWPQFWVGMSEPDKIEGDGRPGSRIEFSLVMMGMHLRQIDKTVEERHNPDGSTDWRWEFEGTAPGWLTCHHEPKDGGTQITTEFDYTLPGSFFGKIADRLVVEKMEQRTGCCWRASPRDAVLVTSEGGCVMRRPTFPLVVVLALALVLLFATTASAKPTAAPHFWTHAVGTFDYTGDEYDPIEGVWWAPVVGDLEHVDGRIKLEVDIESVGDAIGPYDDGSDWNVKWDYNTRGFLKATIRVIDPDGHRVNRVVKARVDKVTVPYPFFNTFYFFEGTFRGEPYSGYIGRGNDDYHLYLPLLGQFLGGKDNYGIVESSLGDFSYELNDTLTP